MRQRAKPFTVEIKKSRKASSEPQSLFGGVFDVRPPGLDEAPATAPERAADRLFGRSVDSETMTLADQVFGAPPAAEAARPETRILPDLTARAPATPEDQPRTRAERVRPSPKPKAVRPKPIPIEIVVRAPVARKAEPAPARPARIRPPRRDDGDLLPRGERWKRRMSPFAR